MHPLAELDHRYLWHPFTQMRDWLRREPIMIAEAHGAVLRDVRGREYLDANSSIGTNLHGHNHPAINGAIRRQLKRIAHSSALGLANEPASRLAAALIKAANKNSHSATPAGPGQNPRTVRMERNGGQRLEKVFFSDDGSTAMEVALKLAFEAARRTGRSHHARFISLEGAYHGDTLGAVAAGHIDLFHRSYADLLFTTDKAPAPYCYRCRFNRAKPERADAREYRVCHWECLDALERKFAVRRKGDSPYAGFVFEPLIQGAAGMIPQPDGWLARATQLASAYGAWLIADEIMTGFGRTGRGLAGAPPAAEPTFFACGREGVRPDFLCLAKGLTGGYLPMAATLTTREVFNAFLGRYDQFKTFFHGHSYTANQLGAAAALASLDVLTGQESVQARRRLEQDLAESLAGLWELPHIGDIRQVGLVAGIELVKNWRTRRPFELRERAGIRVCEAMARHGVLTRPIGNVVVLMPPYCTTRSQLWKMTGVLEQSIRSELRG